MAGHSKWANIKHRKAQQDAKRGKLFNRLIKAIEAAAREGGPDPEANPTLADAIAKAKDASVPKDNIERAVKRASGEDGGVAYEQVFFEGYAPSGVAVYVECLTDNRNRAAMEVRAAFKKHGGSLAEPGAVDYLFRRAGVIVVPVDGADEDAVLEAGLEAGIEEIESDAEHHTITTDPSAIREVRAALEAAGVPVTSAEVTMLPHTQVPVTDEDAARTVMRLIAALDDCDDVQHVYANFDIPDKVLEEVA